MLSERHINIGAEDAFIIYNSRENVNGLFIKRYRLFGENVKCRITIM